MDIDAASVDEVLATTRALHRRLDLERPVANDLLLDCIDLAEQPPTGGNLGSGGNSAARCGEAVTAAVSISAAGKTGATARPAFSASCEESIPAEQDHLACKIALHNRWVPATG